MDLAGMINNGVEALHRGSVDKSSTSSHSSSGSSRNQQAPVGDVRQIMNAESSTSPAPSDIVESSQSTNRAPPRYALVFRGRRNKVNDTRRWKLSETRPELVATMDSDPSGNENQVPRKNTQSEDDFQPSIGTSPFKSISIPATEPSEVGPGGNLSLTGLAASIAALVPSDDETKVMAGWLYENIENVSDDLLNSVEIEFKMGTICDESNMRHRFPMMSEAVVDPAYYRMKGLKFKTSVDDVHFRSLERLLDSLEDANAANDQNQIVKSNILVTDESYTIDIGDTKRRIRLSRDDSGRVVECIEKQRIGDLFIAVPNSPFDLKASMSVEHQIDYQGVVSQKIKGVKPGFERNKNRLKYQAKGCTIDLTSVHGRPVAGTPSGVTKEAEIEANMELLGTILNEMRTSRDKATSLDKFLEIIRYSLDSARFLLRNI